MNQDYTYEESEEDNSELNSQNNDNSYNNQDNSPPVKKKKTLTKKQSNEDYERRSSNFRKKSFSGGNSLEIGRSSMDRRGSQLSGRLEESLENIQEEDDEDDENNEYLDETPKSRKNRKNKKGFRIKGKKKNGSKRGSRIGRDSVEMEEDSVPVREYYEKSLTPILLEGLKELGRKRPDNPVKFLGVFLLKNDPEN